MLSWGGTMFEYLMPQLIMPTYENTLLNQTYRAIVRRQIEYGGQRDVPWGISESGYNMTDVNLIYQYRAFGAPGLGFKRGLIEDLVIAPYASALALMVEPAEACTNMQRMASEGYLGRYGFFEAIDYTPSRLSGIETSATVHSFMAHHQGMSFLSHGLCASRPTYAKKVHGKSDFPGCGSASPRAGSKGSCPSIPMRGGFDINLEGRHAGAASVRAGHR